MVRVNSNSSNNSSLSSVASRHLDAANDLQQSGQASDRDEKDNLKERYGDGGYERGLTEIVDVTCEDESPSSRAIYYHNLFSPSDSPKRFDEKPALVIASRQFIGDVETEEAGSSSNSTVQVLSPIRKNDLWDHGKLLETIAMLNSDKEVRDRINIFRAERREVIGDSPVDLMTF